MWVGDVFKTRDDFVSIIQTDQPPTKHKAAFGDIVVYYDTNGYNLKRYKSSVKYKRMAAWWEYFGYNKKIENPT
jgi:hypothetical protein